MSNKIQNKAHEGTRTERPIERSSPQVLWVDWGLLGQSLERLALAAGWGCSSRRRRSYKRLQLKENRCVSRYKELERDAWCRQGWSSRTMSELYSLLGAEVGHEGKGPGVACPAEVAVPCECPLFPRQVLWRSMLIQEP